MTPTEKFFQRDLWHQDWATVKGLRAWYIKPLRLLVVAVSDFRDGMFSIRATSLVSMTLLSFIPFLAVMFSVLKVFGVHQQVEPVLVQVLEPLGAQGRDIAGRIVEFVNNLKVGALGAVGLAGLLYTTFSLIDQIEKALNCIWRVRDARAFARKITDYVSVILAGPVLVFSAIATIASAQSHWFVQRLLTIEPLGAAVPWVTALMPFVLICLGFAFLYKFVPHTHVSVTSAVVGGVTAGVLWKVAGTLFATFVTEATRYSALYSSFAILILFLIWFYVGWLIVLVGAQVSYYHQHRVAYTTRLRWNHATAAFREYLALTALVHLTRQYRAGAQPCQVQRLAMTLKVPLSALEDIVEDFIDHGVLYQTVHPPGLTLGRSPQQIAVLDVLQLVNHREWAPREAAPTRNDSVEALLHQRDQTVSGALDGVTIAMLAAEASNVPMIQESSVVLPDQPQS